MGCDFACGGDDPPAKGCSAFTAMSELSLLLNKDYNQYVINEFGELYRNPLNALVYLPLLPAFSKVGNIVSARAAREDIVMASVEAMINGINKLLIKNHKQGNKK